MQRIIVHVRALSFIISCTLPIALQSSQLVSNISLPGLEAYSSSLAEPALKALQDYQGITAKVLPSALSNISAAMKDPYVLLIASAGTCLAYVMTGASEEPVVSPEQLIGITQEHMLQLGTAALGGLSYGAGVHIKKGVEQQLTSYAKPILLTGTLGGLVLVNTTLSSEDFPFAMAILNNTLLGLLPDLVSDISVIGKKLRNLLPASKAAPSIKDAASIIKNKAAKKNWSKTVQKFYDVVTSDYVVAFITFGSVITLQNQQAGSLSESDQALAIATLASATQLIQKTVVTDYAIRASKNLCETVTSGLSTAANFSKHVYQTCKTQFSSWLFPEKSHAQEASE